MELLLNKVYCIEPPSATDQREFVPMFEHQLVKKQLQEIIVERNTIKQQYVQIQNDIISLVTMVKSRLFKTLFDSTVDTKISTKFDTSDYFDPDENFLNPMQPYNYDKKGLKDFKSKDNSDDDIKVDKSFYTNTSE